jgi:glycosyltransferase involved in cell wall biosynthesis
MNKLPIIHLFGSTTVPTSSLITCDAFTQTVLKYGKEFKKRSYHVIIYGTKEFKKDFNDACCEFVEISSLDTFMYSVANTSEMVSAYSDGRYLSNLCSKKNLNIKCDFSKIVINNLMKIFSNYGSLKDNILLTFFSISNYEKKLYKIFESKGGMVIEGLVQYGVRKWNIPFRRTVFASTFQMIEKKEIFEGLLNCAKDKTLQWKVIPPLFNSSDFIFNPNPRSINGPYLYLARLQEIKGFGVFLQFAKNNLDKTFWIAGQSTYRNNKLSYSDIDDNERTINLKQYPNIIYKGTVGKRGRAKLLSQSTALIQYTKYCEPFGWNIIEANLSGTPVLTSNFGAFTETVKDGINGFRLNSDELCDKSIFDKLVKLSPQECYDHGLQYSADNIMKTYIEFINECHSNHLSMLIE